MFRTLRKKENDIGTMEHGILYMRCTGCSHDPDLGTAGCMRCVVRTITGKGEPERIVLRGGSDREYHGDAVDIMNRLAEVVSVAAASFSRRNGRRTCSSCPADPSRISHEIGEMFPSPCITDIRERMRTLEPSDRGCEECMMNVYRGLEEVEYMLSLLSRHAARTAFGLAEV